jgi:hypothetical protein
MLMTLKEKSILGEIIGNEKPVFKIQLFIHLIYDVHNVNSVVFGQLYFPIFPSQLLFNDVPKEN